MKMTTICFVRHGRTKVNIKMLIQGQIDNPLSEDGKKDALVVSNLLKEHNLKFDIIISSPLSRAYDTATIIKNDNESLKDIPVVINKTFIERDFGSADGAPITPENYQKVMDETFKGMEKGVDLCKRTLYGVNELINNYPDKTILVVCHSHVIKSIFMQFDNNVHFNTKFGHHNINILQFNGNKILDCKFNIC